MRKILFAFIVSFMMAFNSFATTLPVHHAYTEFNGQTREFIKKALCRFEWNGSVAQRAAVQQVG